MKSMFEELYILCLFYHGQDLELRSRKSLDPNPDSVNHNTVQLLPSEPSVAIKANTFLPFTTALVVYFINRNHREGKTKRKYGEFREHNLF